MSLWTLIDFSGSVIILVVGGVIWWHHFRNPPDRRTWRCFRWHGGGALISPRPMTVEEVTAWLGRDNNSEVGHIDTEHGFIFYRPRG